MLYPVVYRDVVDMFSSFCINFYIFIQFSRRNAQLLKHRTHRSEFYFLVQISPKWICLTLFWNLSFYSEKQDFCWTILVSEALCNLKPMCATTIQGPKCRGTRCLFEERVCVDIEYINIWVFMGWWAELNMNGKQLLRPHMKWWRWLQRDQHVTKPHKVNNGFWKFYSLWSPVHVYYIQMSL